MRKTKFMIALLTCSLLLSLFTPTVAALAEENNATDDSTGSSYIETIHISTAEDLLTLADSCRLDTWSVGRLVILEADIDLTGTDFAGIPTFGGAFDGDGHTIQGLSITKEGNVQGFFRYLQTTAIVYDLHVEGDIRPAGTSSILGGIAGTNAGQILECTFTGDISGTDRIGGLVGNNEVTGILEHCDASGTIQGSHFSGGLAGDNHGVIRDCTNHAAINTSASQNTVSLEDITLENMTNSEAAYTATDMGGIAGTSSGVIRNCINYGNVGYQSMSYNAGGIAGSLTGYLVDCENHGVIYARKDVGGIVGQLEPSNVIEYSEDTLQILSSQIDSLNNIAHRTGSHANSGSKEIDSQLRVLQSQSSSARSAVEMLLRQYEFEEWDPEDFDPDKFDPSQFDPDNFDPDQWFSGDSSGVDPDTLTAARNDLSSSLNEMSGTMEGLAGSMTATVNNLTNDIKAMTNQLQSISSTLNHAEENLGITVTDISDLDTEEDTISKSFSCVNYGEVHADQNGGGIVGSMGLENDWDPEDDVDFRGETSLNFSYEIRSVIRDCRNHAPVSVKKNNAGGIVGNMSTGAVFDCVNLGTLDASAAERVGGIAGSSSAILRRCDAKCAISGQSQVGGIAGIGSTVTDCRSLVRIDCDGPECGAILGSSDTAMSLQAALTEEARTVSANYYLAPGTDIGAIDGISYSGCGEPLNLTDFLAIEELPEYFTTMTVRFVCEGQEDMVFQIPVGGSFPMEQIPAVPVKDIHDGEWEGLTDADLSVVWFDETFSAVYKAYHQTLQTEDTRANGLPVVLAAGDFPTDSKLTIESTVKAPSLADGTLLLESWQLISQAESQLSVHYQPDEAALAAIQQIQIYVQDDMGTWTKRPATIDGRYLVFAMAEDEDTFCAVQLPKDYTPYYLAACGAGIIILTILICVVIKKIRHSRKHEIMAETTEHTESQSSAEAPK